MRTTPILIALSLLAVGALAAAPLTTADPCADGTPGCANGPVKATCSLSVSRGVPNPLNPSAVVGSQIVTLNCPGHILAGVDYGYKSCDPAIPGSCPAPADIVGTDLGATPDPTTPCGWSHTWVISAPNLNTYGVFFRATTWKDADCDGAADDWNTGGVSADGTIKCYWQNYFGPKTADYPPSAAYPYTAPPFGPLPDGELNFCDHQIFEIQWKQFN